MGTNYYAHIIPSYHRKSDLCLAIESDNFELIRKLTDEMYSSIRMDYGNDEIIGGTVHLGKRSSGWKFLWNPNVFVIRNGHTEWEETPNGRSGHWIPEPSCLKYLYPLTKEGIKSFIDRNDVIIYDEYDEYQDKNDFWEMALTWEQEDGFDSASYEEYNKREGGYHQYPITGELTDLLIDNGYKFTSYSNSDFYSDGLRFSGFTEFC